VCVCVCACVRARVSLCIFLINGRTAHVLNNLLSCLSYLWGTNAFSSAVTSVLRLSRLVIIDDRLSCPTLWNISAVTILICDVCSLNVPLSSRGSVVSNVSCRCTYCCLETSHGKITRHCSRYCTVAFCYVLKCELSYMCPGHDIKLHLHRVKLYRIGCLGWLGIGKSANVIINN